MVAGGNWPRFNIIMRKSVVDGTLDTREFPECDPKWHLFNVPSTSREIFDVAQVRPSSLRVT